MFNRNGGPSATEALHGATDQPGAEGPHPTAKPREVAELIGQEVLSLGDGPQRGLVPPAREPRAEAPARAAEGLHGPPPAAEKIEASAYDNAVRIEVRRLPTRGGRRPSKEKYPFGAIGLARDVDGFLEGETFLIPHEDEPRKRIAAGRKRHKPKRFLTRSELAGVRVWRDR